MSKLKYNFFEITSYEISDLFFNTVKDYEDREDIKKQAQEFLENLPSLKEKINTQDLTDDFYNRL